uniref:Uncharacterized protein n=1 Tax=Fagus sylvatica TaxID=28930 RepID=A0A2N9GK24_FAGSY
MLGSKTKFEGDTTQFTGILVLLVKIYQIMLRDFTKDSRALCAGVSDMCSIRVSKELGSGRPQAAHLAVHVALSWAPQMSPNHPSLEDNSSLSPKENITVDAAECKTNCLPASLLESENMGTVPLANNPVEDDLASEVTEFSGKAIISLKIYKFNEEFILDAAIADLDAAAIADLDDAAIADLDAAAIADLDDAAIADLDTAAIVDLAAALLAVEWVLL